MGVGWMRGAGDVSLNSMMLGVDGILDEYAKLL